MLNMPSFRQKSQEHPRQTSIEYLPGFSTHIMLMQNRGIVICVSATIVALLKLNMFPATVKHVTKVKSTPFAQAVS